jgi:hypothetical protein
MHIRLQKKAIMITSEAYHRSLRLSGAPGGLRALEQVPGVAARDRVCGRDAAAGLEVRQRSVKV